MNSAALARFEGLSSEDPEKWQIAEQFAHALGREFLQNYQLVQNRTDSQLEMRGTWHGHPVRMKLCVATGSIEWDMQSQNATQQTLYLFWDEDAIPNVGQFSGEFAQAWEQDSEEKVFFARGMYLETDAQEMPRVLAVYSALPPDVRSYLTNLMVSDKIAKLYAYDHGALWLDFSKALHELTDPLNQVARGVWLMGQMTWGLSRVNPATLPAVLSGNAPQPHQGNLIHKMVCRYCTTHFLLEQSQRCPNCGAPPQ